MYKRQTYLGANAHRGDYEMSAQVDAAFEGARVRTQKFLNAKHKEEIVFTSGSVSYTHLAFVSKYDAVSQCIC